jgi:hypothetical protein
VLVGREKLSLVPVDKPVESVDNKWIDPTLSASSIPLSVKKALFNPKIYTERGSYPQLSTSFPHLGVKVSKRTSLKESLTMTGRGFSLKRVERAKEGGLVGALLLNLGGDLIDMVIESTTFSH